MTDRVKLLNGVMFHLMNFAKSVVAGTYISQYTVTAEDIVAGIERQIEFRFHGGGLLQDESPSPGGSNPQGPAVNPSTTPPTPQVPSSISYCRYDHHTDFKGQSTVGKPVEKCPFCAARKVCGPFSGHVCLTCEPLQAVPCGMCKKPQYLCNC